MIPIYLFRSSRKDLSIMMRLRISYLFLLVCLFTPPERTTSLSGQTMVVLYPSRQSRRSFHPYPVYVPSVRFVRSGQDMCHPKLVLCKINQVRLTTEMSSIVWSTNPGSVYDTTHYDSSPFRRHWSSWHPLRCFVGVTFAPTMVSRTRLTSTHPYTQDITV